MQHRTRQSGLTAEHFVAEIPMLKQTETPAQRSFTPNTTNRYNERIASNVFFSLS